ncbi:retinal-specific phospholipid-transporting ATPase ABCA4-like [Physella acuta]|uniref:retinal-specific phospholipid-transporting ATPase ABCA4-like n=1 Tax=Physella acuta TaxID=109671 RepID=UPI0027DD2F90|nr:retinal-specific phospholipid-transporting ATPase ABCA4-like [Physella acuta]
MGALLYKTWHQHRRSYIMILVEIVFPYLMSFLLAYTFYEQSATFGFDTLYLNKEVLDKSRSWHPLSYFPKETAYSDMMRIGREPLTHPEHLAFNSLKEAEEFMEQVSMYRHIVQFERSTNESILTYTVLLDNAKTPTDVFLDCFKESVDYLTTTQLVIAQTYIRYWNLKLGKTNNADIQISMQELPHPGHFVDTSGNVILLRLLFPFYFIWLAVFTSKWIVDDDLMRYKHSMSILGLNKSVYWMSWLIIRCMMGLIPTFITLYMMTSTEPHSTLLKHENSIGVLFWLILTNVNTVSFGFIVSLITISGWFPNVIAFITYLAVCSISTLITLVKSPVLSNIFGTFIYYIGISVCHEAIVLQKFSLQDNDHVASHFHYPFSMKQGMILMTCNTLFNLLFTWYLQTIISGELGLQKALFHLFSARFWLKDKTIQFYELAPQHQKYIQPLLSDETEEIVTKNVVKTFGHNVALHGVSVNFLKDKTTVILGEFNSGKSTLISILLGLVPMTSGSVYMEGCNITENLPDVRYEKFGVCPQENIILAKLTCLEHLIFVYKLRHEFVPTVKDEIKELLALIRLNNQSSVLTTRLSSGQKRKLCVASAFLGKFKTIFVDEPTCGLDERTRRDLWNFFKSFHHKRTLIMTTHNVTEADVLGDKIVLMKQGIVNGCGSMSFLKKLYGAGYMLRLLKHDLCDDYVLYRHVMNTLETAKLKVNTLNEMVFFLPDYECRRFSALFSSLKQNMDKLKIIKMKVSAFSFVDIFQRINDGMKPTDWAESEMKISSESLEELDKDDAFLISPAYEYELIQSNRIFSDTIIDKNDLQRCMVDYKANEGAALFCQQLYAMFVKKWIFLNQNLELVYRIITLHMALTSVCMAVVYFTSSGNNGTTQINLAAGLEEKVTIAMRIPNERTVAIFERLNESLPQNFERLYVNMDMSFPTFLLDWIKTNASVDSVTVLGVDLYEPPFHNLVYTSSPSVYTQVYVIQSILNAHIKAYFGSNHTIISRARTFYSIPQKSELNSSKYSSLEQMHIYLPAWALSVALWSTEAYILYSLVIEKSSGFKHLQLISGLSPSRYWSAHFLFDSIVCLFVALLQWTCSLVHPAIQVYTPLLLTLTFFVLDIIPYLYLLNYCLGGPEESVTLLIAWNFVVVMLDESQAAKLLHFEEFVTSALDIISPNLMLHKTLLKLFDRKYTQQDIDFQEFEWCDQTARFFLLHAICSWFILLIIELNYVQRIWYAYCCCCADIYVCFNDYTRIHRARYKKYYANNTAVQREMVRVLTEKQKGNIEQDIVVFLNMCKKYRIKHRILTAVENTCLGISPGAIFGFLGNHGSGKTSILKMMTGELMLTYGDIYYSGQSIKSHLSTISKQIGYCPQSKTLMKQLTGRQTLELFGRLRGVPENKISHMIDYVTQMIFLFPYVDFLVKQYSCANRKKLSFAIAMIGVPKLLLMDEPTRGVEPFVRFAMWNFLKQYQKLGSTIILATKSFAESNSLCTKMAVLIDGKVVCLGIPQELQRKYENYYTISFQLKDLGEANKQVPIYIKKAFRKVMIFETSNVYIHFQIPENLLSLSKLFTVMENAKTKLNLDSYTVHENSLELMYQLFLWKEED